MSAVEPEQLRSSIAGGLLSFPLTDFDAEDRFDPASYARRLEWLAGFGAAGIFAAGGAGEFFSLDDAEYRAVTGAAVAAARGAAAPVIASTGYGTRKAVALAKEAERLGADGLLIMPPYLVEPTQEGLHAHIEAICSATRLGAIVYNRANCRIKAETFASLLDRCPNLIGFKDGVGDIGELQRVQDLCGDRILVINGMPTAEIFARAFNGMGVSTYSSAIFNFIPETAMAFHRAVIANDGDFQRQFMRDFLLPYLDLCSRHAAYAVSMIKAGARIVGRSAGTARPPLSMPTVAEQERLAQLIARAGRRA